MAQELDSIMDAVHDFKVALEALPSSKKLSRPDADAIYALAYNFVSQGHYESAFRYFSLLTLYHPTNIIYLSGLALTYKLMGRLGEAIGVYSWLAVFDPEDPAHTLAIAECQLLARDYEQGQETLDMVIRACDEKGGHERVRLRALALRGLVKPGAVPAGS
jgi:type III secretion system low calcium response chaperone LcrH/SycD